ncbi:MAG: hypothetical protein C4294_12485 [Nitrospiraceae bacterium]
MKLRLIDKGRERDKDVFYCLFETETDKRLRVIVTGQQLSDFKRDLKETSDVLERACHFAAELAVTNGILEDDVEMVGKVYRDVKKRLSTSEAERGGS